MKSEQIMKALELCGSTTSSVKCAGCPYGDKFRYPYCLCEMTKDAKELIETLMDTSAKNTCQNGEKPKLIPIAERNPNMRCWYCRSDKSVKYTARIMNPSSTSERRYVDIFVCNKCALNHASDFIPQGGLRK